MGVRIRVGMNHATSVINVQRLTAPKLSLIVCVAVAAAGSKEFIRATNRKVRITAP